MRLFDDEHPLLCLLNEVIFHHLNCYMVVSSLYQVVSMPVFHHRSVLTEGVPVAVLLYCQVPLRLHHHKRAECLSAKPASFSLSTQRMT